MGGKWLEKVREIAPRAERVGLVFHPEPPNIGYLKSAEAAAPSLKINVVGLAVHSGAEIERVLATFAAKPRGSLIVAPNVVTFANSNLIIALAARNRLPAIYPFAFYARAGGLISYGFDQKAPAGQESRDTLCRLFRPGRNGRLESVRRTQQCRRSRKWVHIGNPG